MARGDSIRFGFATGRVMVLRSRLLGDGAYERLIDAPSFAEQRRVLTETYFGRFLEGAHTASDVERAVDESLRDLYEDFLLRAELPAAIVSFFQAPYDFSTLKTVLRSRALGVQPEAPVVVLGGVPFGAFGSPETLPGALGEAAREVLAADPPLSSEGIDAAIDRHLFAELCHLAKRSKIRLLVRLAERQADAANAKVLLRGAVAGRTPEDVRAMLVPGGAWDTSPLLRLVKDPQSLAEAVLSSKVLRAPSAEVLLDFEKLDVIVDAAVAAVSREAARGEIGPEPVLGYVLQRRAEAIGVRAALVGRLAGLPRELLAARVKGAAS